MKTNKIISIFCACVFGVGAAFGATVCAKTGTFAGILKKNVAGTSSESDNSTKVWRVVYNYATLTGLAACNEISGTYGTPLTNLSTSYVDVGQYCWCKLEPVESYGYATGITSYWVFLNTYTDAATCGNSCTAACRDAMASNTTFRSAVFESVW